MTGSIIPKARTQFISAIGLPLIGGKVWTYNPGTTTPKATYQDEAMTILNTNPITLDARGEAAIWGLGDYQMVVYDIFGNQLWSAVTAAPISASQLSDTITGLVSVADLASIIDNTKGDAMVGFIQPAAGAVGSNLHKKMIESISVIDFGADPTGTAFCAKSFQDAISAASALATVYGSGRVYVPAGTYKLNYPVFIPDNVEVFGAGPATKVTWYNPSFSTGRGGFVIGSSYEANRTLALAAYANGTYPGATTINPSFTNPVLKQYLRDNQSFVQTTNASVHDMYLACILTGAGSVGYAINFANAQHSQAYNIWGSGWTELINMGSDTTPETPSNYDCHAWNLIVVSADLVGTYYSIGFIANSTNCTIRNGIQTTPMTAGTPNGSGVATNVVQYCEITNIFIPNLGRTASSEGVLLNNALGCLVDDIYVGNAVSAVSSYYTDATFNDSANPNHIGAVKANNCTYALSLRAKYVAVEDVQATNCGNDVYFGNINATNNTLRFTPVNMAFNTAAFPYFYLTSNTVRGWTYQRIYLRPINFLLNDKTDLLSWNNNFNLATKVATPIQVLYTIPANVKAVVDANCFLTFGLGGLTAGSNLAMSLRRIVAYDGNSGAAPYVELTNTHTATADTVQDTTLNITATATTPGYVLASDTTNGLAYSLDLCLEFNAPVNNCYLKTIRLGFFA